MFPAAETLQGTNHVFAPCVNLKATSKFAVDAQFYHPNGPRMPVNLKKFSHPAQRSLHMLNIFIRLLPSSRKLQKGVPLKAIMRRCPHWKQSSIRQRELLAVVCPVDVMCFCQQGVGWQILFTESENKYGLRGYCTDPFLKAFVQQLLALANAYRPLARFFWLLNYWKYEIH